MSFINAMRVASLRERGFVVVRELLSQEEAEECREELVEHLESTPRVSGDEIRLEKLEGLTLAEQKALCRIWLPDKTSGIISEPPSFHMKSSWRVRQNETLVSLMSRTLGAPPEALRVSLDGYTAKVPRSGGRREGPHYTVDPRGWSFEREKQTYRCFVSYTRAKLYIIPRTHSEEYRRSAVCKSSNRFYLRDPVDEVVVNLSPGDALIVNERLARASRPHTTSYIVLGIEMSYCVAGRELQAEDDRLRSYQTGKAPSLLHNGEEFSYMPKSWRKFTNQVRRYHLLLPEELRHEKNDKPVILENDPRGYTPPVLTPLGYSLLNGEVKSKDARDTTRTIDKFVEDSERDQGTTGEDEQHIDCTERNTC